MFCAKEALLKTTQQSTLMKNIEVKHDAKGKPSINLLLSDIKGDFKLSISHTKDIAIAQVLRL
jgi:phosphopantetheinyl transferase (holo-ACP synthase)